VPLKLSGTKERLHLLRMSTRSHEHFPVSLPKSAIPKIATPNSQKAFQDGTAVVQSSGTAVQIKCGKKVRNSTQLVKYST